ncbi:protein of unknown function [Candidatus Nitrosotalea okcheonensis]|uniref:C2H2-type domain-containing protein n=1 Tax=Candidatus Nitrosotalea okcheonensis TaxID=1903276 RepID=A0A2H1FDR5_9ARCH|nr:protein of unknown function [Candidatus Nitrosotalea okcheonensis]
MILVLKATEKKCDICGSKFESSNKLSQHKESHKKRILLEGQRPPNLSNTRLQELWLWPQ